MFASITSWLRAAHEQHQMVTQVGYVSSPNSMEHPSALPQIAATVKSIQNDRSQRRSIEQWFDNLSADAGTRLRYAIIAS
jgi:hypothetical protein